MIESVTISTLRSLAERGIFMNSRSKAYVVWLILNGRAEEALELLAEDYRVSVPKLRVGLPKARRKNVSGTYNTETGTIAVLDSDALKQPFVILHEFYHHLRTGADLKHRGTERNANQFAQDFVQVYGLLGCRDAGND